MVYEIRLPDLPEEAAIIAWNMEIGAAVETGDVLCEIEVGKAVQQITSPGSGILRAIFQDEGILMIPGTLLAVVADMSDDISAYQAG